jgi:polysaccharide pyruvyl transferase WcaK-like protein
MLISIISPGGISNFGERAIMMGTVMRLKNEYPDSGITVFGYTNLVKDDPFLDGIFKKFNVKTQPEMISGKNKFYKILKIVGLFLLPSSVLGRKNFYFLKKSDIVISKGQETFTGSYGFIHFFDSFLEAYIVSRFNPNIILFGQSIGPFKNSLQKKIALFVLKKIKIVCPRDTISKQLLISIGCDKTKIKIIKDLAYYAMPYFNENLKNTPKNEVMIIPNKSILKNHFQDNAYIKNLLDIIKILQDNNIKVVLSSSVTADDWNNDYALCNRIKMINRKVEIRFYKTLEEIVRDIKNVNFLISSRLHPLILATGMNKKIIALTKAPKIIGVLKDLGGDYLILDPFTSIDKKNIEKTCLP